MSIALALLVSYLLGSFPTGFVFVKWLKRVDVRTVGSGNIGATNVARVAGVWVSLVVFLIDAAKGLVAVHGVAPWLLPEPTLAGRLACGLVAVLGHTFPIFLKCKGGKGVATTIGVLLSAMPFVGVIYLAVWVGCLALWRYVSLGSIAAALTIPLSQALLQHDRAARGLGIVLALLIIGRHRANIRRLLRGEEPKLGTRVGSRGVP